MKVLTAKNNKDWTLYLNGEVLCSKDTKDDIYKISIYEDGDEQSGYATVYSWYKVKKVDDKTKSVYLENNRRKE